MTTSEKDSLASKKRVWEFDRYVDGRLMAEGVRISRAETFEEACRAAVSLASPGSVLVVRPSDETRARLRECGDAVECDMRITIASDTDEKVSDCFRAIDDALTALTDRHDVVLTIECITGSAVNAQKANAGEPPELTQSGDLASLGQFARK